MTLSCSASGDPAPTITWIKDGSIISTIGDPRIIFGVGNKTLAIRNVNRTDSGQYQCVASNGIGSVATSNGALLDVQCKHTTKEFTTLVFIHYTYTGIAN